MSKFLDLLEQEENNLIELEESFINEIEEFIVNEADEEDLSVIFSESGLTREEFDDVLESLRKRVSSTGKVTRVKSRQTRRRRATMTTGMSKSALRRRARKAARTLKRNPATARKALKKRRKALRKRKQRGL